MKKILIKVSEVFMWLVVSVASVASVVSVLQQKVTFFASRRCQGLPFCLWVFTTFRQYLWEGEGTDMAQLKGEACGGVAG